MKRLVIIFVVFALAASAAVLVAVRLWGMAAVREGRALHSVRRLESQTIRRAPKLPLVVWVGDSTILPGRAGIVPYPVLIRERLREARRPVENLVLAQPGIGPFVEYGLVANVTALHPDVLVIIANYGALTRSGPERGALLTAPFIPSREWRRAALLPWYFADVSVPRVFMARLLRSPSVSQTFLFAEGLRQMFRDEIYTSSRKLDLEDQFRVRRRGGRHYLAPIDERSPQVVMLGAAVELAVRNGIRTTVVLTPIAARMVGLSEAEMALIGERTKVVGRAVGEAGGRFLDLHHAGARGMFRDFGGHLTEKGMKQMVAFVEPFVRQDVVALYRQRARERAEQGL